jgi:hypothetical protein
LNTFLIVSRIAKFHSSCDSNNNKVFIQKNENETIIKWNCEPVSSKKIMISPKSVEHKYEVHGTYDMLEN